MIRIGLLMLIAMLLPGCTIYNAIGDSFGSYVSPPAGQEFQPVGYRWDYEHTALIYVYRPASTWANDELESPSFYMNDERLFNIKGDGYTWYELKPGEHNIVIRRPLMGISGIRVDDVVDFSLKEVALMDINAKAGEVYYLRYAEVDQDAPLFKDMTFHKNPLELVEPSVALAEIQQTSMIHNGRGLIAAAPVIKVEKPVIDEDAVKAQLELQDEQDQNNEVKGVEKTEDNDRNDDSDDDSWSPF